MLEPPAASFRAFGPRPFRGRVLWHGKSDWRVFDGRIARAPAEPSSKHVAANVDRRPAQRRTRRPVGGPLGLGTDVARTGGEHPPPDQAVSRIPGTGRL